MRLLSWKVVRALDSLLLALGLVLILEGVPYFLFPRALQQLIERMGRADPLNLRLLGGAMVGAGLLVVYWVRTHG